VLLSFLAKLPLTAWLGAIIFLLGEIFALLPLIYDFYPI